MSILPRLFAGWLCVSVALVAAVSGARRPNVLIVLADDQGYGDIGAHGNPVLRTPHLDRLHAESVRFTDFHAAPMCTPTRGQLLTGVDALRNGAMNVSSGRTNLRREFPTMPEIFGAHGYATGIFGKWHLGDGYPYRPQDRGFRESVWFPSSHIPSAAGHFDNDYFDDVYEHNGGRRRFEGYTTDVFFREAMRWMGECQARGEPFLCYVPLAAAHGPLFVPDRYREPYRNQRPAVASFFGMIANIDENLGRLEEFLRERGLRDDTIVLYLTDNGTANGDPVFNAGMRGKKISLHEGGHRVPCFVRWPGGKLRAPGEVAELAQMQDLLPTLLELAGVPAPAGARFDGTSLAGLLRGAATVLPDRMLVTQFSRMNDPRPKRGDATVMWRRWRLVADAELHDLATDPGQKTNVIARFPDVAEKMRAHYARWWEGVAPRIDESVPLHLGAPGQGPVTLTPCDWRDVFLDQQAQIRRLKRNGPWQVRVERAGQYRFELRRWPAEADLAITAAAPEHRGVDGVYREGEAWPVASAELVAAGQRREAPVTAADRAVAFALRLDAGAAEIRATFRNAAGGEIGGAYYVTVTGPQ